MKSEGAAIGRQTKRLRSSTFDLQTEQNQTNRINEINETNEMNARLIGGGSRIRTHGGRKPTTAFKAAALNHSAIPPHDIQAAHVGT